MRQEGCIPQQGIVGVEREQVAQAVDDINWCWWRYRLCFS